jgi:hypothetical protein
MVALSDSRDDFIHSLHRYIIPALQSAGEKEADIVAAMQVLSHCFTITNCF